VNINQSNDNMNHDFYLQMNQNDHSEQLPIERGKMESEKDLVIEQFEPILEKIKRY